MRKSLDIDLGLYIDEFIIDMLVKCNDDNNNNPVFKANEEKTNESKNTLKINVKAVEGQSSFQFHLVEKTLGLCFGTVSLHLDKTKKRQKRKESSEMEIGLVKKEVADCKDSQFKDGNGVFRTSSKTSSPVKLTANENNVEQKDFCSPECRVKCFAPSRQLFPFPRKLLIPSCCESFVVGCYILKSRRASRKKLVIY